MGKKCFMLSREVVLEARGVSDSRLQIKRPNQPARRGQQKTEIHQADPAQCGGVARVQRSAGLDGWPARATLWPPTWSSYWLNKKGQRQGGKKSLSTQKFLLNNKNKNRKKIIVYLYFLAERGEISILKSGNRKWAIGNAIYTSPGQPK